MAVHPTCANLSQPRTAPDSDYGSDIDIDDATADQLFSQSESQLPLKVLDTPITDDIQEAVDADLTDDVLTHNFSVRLAKLRQSLGDVEESRAKLEAIVQMRRREAAVEVEYERHRMVGRIAAGQGGLAYRGHAVEEDQARHRCDGSSYARPCLSGCGGDGVGPGKRCDEDVDLAELGLRVALRCGQIRVFHI